MSILIKNVHLAHDITDIFIKGKLISQTGKNLQVTAQKIIDGHRKAVIPGLINGHNHAAMTLFRGWGDDLPLEQWLNNRIWPIEAKLTEEDVYWGAKLACVEMIKSGTTCFNDGYFFSHSTARAVEEMGMRAVLAEAVFDFFDKEKSQSAKTKILQYFENSKKYSDRLHFALGPHATYTVSTELLQWIHHFALSNNLLIHLHLAESRTEHKETIARFGLSPVRYLKKAGLLSPHLIIAHGLWLDKEEIKMLADNDVRVIHNPNSNLKLASGYRFKYEEMKMAGITVGIGTDGCASSNNLDMIEAMKTASLLQKTWRYNPTIMPAQEALHCATLNGAKILRLNAGKIEPGCLADLCLIDLNTIAFTPNFDFVSNLVYAAHSDCVDTVICNGKILMENRHIPEEQNILHKTTEIAHRLIKK